MKEENKNSNTGNRNTGNSNTGNRNTGNRNTGNWNTGDWNTGNRNTGNSNTGNRNTGEWNTGNSNTGDWNTGDWNTGFFNTVTPDEILAFNKKTSRKSWDDCKIPLFIYEININEWVSESDMTTEEKKENSTFHTTGGYLKTITYKEAWKKAWDKASDKDKELLKKLPNFNAGVFEEITGINVEEKSHTIIIDGKEIKLSEDSFNELKNSLK